MYRYFEFANLSIMEQIQIYRLVCRNFMDFSLSFEAFRLKHLGYIGTSFGYLYTDKNNIIRGWRAYLPLMRCSNDILHLAGVEAVLYFEGR